MTRPIKLLIGVARWVACCVLLAAAGGCSRFDLLNATVPSSGYLRTADIPYGPLTRQKLDIYVPDYGTGSSTATFNGGRGVVVFFYGGAWQAGDKYDYRFVAEALVSQGFVAVLPDYRLYPSIKFPAFVEDGAMAVRWVNDHVDRFGGDPKRIFLMGHSAGAHIAAMLTLNGEYLNAVGLDRKVIRATAALSGPYDFVPSRDDRAVFGMARDETTTYPAMEPITYADGTEPPMLLVHGTSDDVVGVGNAERLATKIRWAGGQVRVIEYKDVGHVGVVLSLAKSFRFIAPTLKDVTDYFTEQ